MKSPPLGAYRGSSRENIYTHLILGELSDIVFGNVLIYGIYVEFVS